MSFVAFWRPALPIALQRPALRRRPSPAALWRLAPPPRHNPTAAGTAPAGPGSSAEVGSAPRHALTAASAAARGEPGSSGEAGPAFPNPGVDGDDAQDEPDIAAEGVAEPLVPAEDDADAQDGLKGALLGEPGAQTQAAVGAAAPKPAKRQRSPIRFDPIHPPGGLGGM